MQFSRQGLLERGLGPLALRLPNQTLSFSQVDWRLHVSRREGTYRPFFQSTYRRELSDGEIRTLAEFPDVTLRTVVGEMTTQYQFRIVAGQRPHSGDFRLRW